MTNEDREEQPHQDGTRDVDQERSPHLASFCAGPRTASVLPLTPLRRALSSLHAGNGLDVLRSSLGVVRPDQLERRLRKRLDALGPAPAPNCSTS